MLRSRRERAAALVLASLAVLTAAVWAVWGQRDVFLVVAVLVAAYTLHVRRRIGRVVADVEGAAQDLVILSHVLRRLERENFRSPRLALLRAELDVEGALPSRRIARLNRLMELLDSRDNVVVRVVGQSI